LGVVKMGVTHQLGDRDPQLISGHSVSSRKLDWKKGDWNPKIQRYGGGIGVRNQSQGGVGGLKWKPGVSSLKKGLEQ